VEVDLLRREPAPQRQVELAARGDVAGHALLGQQPVGRGAGERLARVDHLEAVGALAEALDVGAGPCPDVVDCVDIGRRAELRRDVEHVTAADLEVAALVQARPDREDV
jgi:hypothetical protein